MKHEVGQGTLLIAGPRLVDPNFRRTVVLLCEHNDEGSLGLVLNRPIDAPLGKVFPQFASIARDPGYVYCGGPVDNTRMLALQRLCEDDAGIESWRADPSDQVHVRLVADVEGALTAIEEGTSDPGQFRFYLGYAGWGPGQLDQELGEDSWVVRPADVELVFHDHPERTWSSALQQLGGVYRLYAQMPLDPGLN